MNEYVIINKSAILKKIQELEQLHAVLSKDNPNFLGTVLYEKSKTEKQTLLNVLSESTPLTVEVNRQ